MEATVKDLIGKLGTPEVLNSRFLQLINSLSGIRTLSNLGSQYIEKEQLIDSMMESIIEYLEVEEVSLYLLENKSLNCIAHLNWEQFIK